MPNPIQNIDSARALQILAIVCRSHRNQQPSALTPNLRKELALTFDLPDAASEPVSDEELAKQALLLLAEDPERRAAIETMAAQPELGRQKFDMGLTIGLTAAVLLVLQTHVRFERHEDGKWSVKIEKKPTSDALLKSLVQKLLNFKD